jgi:hypothetical protein
VWEGVHEESLAVRGSRRGSTLRSVLRVTHSGEAALWLGWTA